MEIIKKYNRRIERSIEDGTYTNKAIGMYLRSMWSKKMTLPKIKEFSTILNISPSAISKYIKELGLENYSVLRFIFKEWKKFEESKTDDLENLLNESINHINNSKKILFIGEGASGTTNYSFNINLLKYGFHSIWSPAPGDQVYLAAKLTENDLIIATSISLKELWIKRIINETKAKVILISANNIISAKVDVFIKIMNYAGDLENKFPLAPTNEINTIFNGIYAKLDVQWYKENI